MKKILFLLNEYSPEFSANSSCVTNVINELKKKNVVDILTFSGNDNLLEKEVIDEVTVHRVKCNLKSDYNKMYKKEYKINVFLYIYKKIRNKLLVLFMWPDFTITKLNAYKKKAIKLIYANKYDVLISSSGDFLVQVIGAYIKEKYPSLKWIAYFNDPMPYNNFIYLKAITTIMNLKKQQKKVLEYADSILYDIELYKKYIDIFPMHKNKMIAVGIPSLIEQKVDHKHDRIPSEYINVVYAGFLYRTIRNPEFLLNIIINSNLPIKLNIYGSGDCLDIISKYSQNYKDKIQYHGQILQSEARNKIINAGILVNICNIVSEQVPSKLFEYMATGLPILNIVKNENDPVIEYINKYENGINIFEKSDIKQASKKLDEFCENFAYKRISFEKTKQEFARNAPEYTKDIIESLL